MAFKANNICNPDCISFWFWAELKVHMNVNLKHKHTWTHDDTRFLQNKYTRSMCRLELCVCVCVCDLCLWCVLILASDWSVGTGVAGMNGAWGWVYPLIDEAQWQTVGWVYKSRTSVIMREEMSHWVFRLAVKMKTRSFNVLFLTFHMLLSCLNSIGENQWMWHNYCNKVMRDERQKMVIKCGNLCKR